MPISAAMSVSGAQRRRLGDLEVGREAHQRDRPVAQILVGQPGGGAQLVGLVRALPGEVRVVAAEVAVGGGLLEDRPAQVSERGMPRGRRSKCSATSVRRSATGGICSVPNVSTSTDTGRATPMA